LNGLSLLCCFFIWDSSETVSVDNLPTKAQQVSSNTSNISVDAVTKNQVFGKVPTFVNYLLVNSDIAEKPSDLNLGSSDLFPNEDSRDNYIKLVVCIMFT